MTAAVLLDSGPLGLLANPARTPAALAALQWLEDLQAAGSTFYVPEIADYEVRRELLRAGKTASVGRLDLLKSRAQYVPITTAAMLLAAELWARARQQGQPTAAGAALDGDVILAAQAITLAVPGLVIATDNAGHLRRYHAAEEWRSITP